MLPDELWSLELRELLLMREGRNRRHEQLIREMWEATRFQTFYLLNVHLDKKNMVKTPEKLIRFSWDKDRKQEVITPEQLEEMFNRFPSFDSANTDRECPVATDAPEIKDQG